MTRGKGPGLNIAVVVAALAMPFAARAADAPAAQAALQQAVQKGADLFAHESFGQGCSML